MSPQDFGGDTPHRHPNTTMMMITDITLSHIPELSISLSDTSQVLDGQSPSTSFQMPTTRPNADADRNDGASASPSPNWLLLADDSLDGFESLRRAAAAQVGIRDERRVANDSFATLDMSGDIPTWSQKQTRTGAVHGRFGSTGEPFELRSPPRGVPLMLNQLTPKPEPTSLPIRAEMQLPSGGDDTKHHVRFSSPSPPPEDHNDANETPYHQSECDTPRNTSTTLPLRSTPHTETPLPPSRDSFTRAALDYSEDLLAHVCAEVKTTLDAQETEKDMPIRADPPLSTEDAVVEGAVHTSVQDAEEEVEEGPREGDGESPLPQPLSRKHRNKHSVPNSNSKLNLDLNPRTNAEHKTKPRLEPKKAALPKTVVNGGGISKIPAPKRVHHVVRPVTSKVQQRNKPPPSSSTSSTHDLQPHAPSSHHLGDQPPTTITTDPDDSAPQPGVHGVISKDDTRHTNPTHDIIENDPRATPSSSRGARAGGVTERLVSYGQHLLSSIRRYSSTAVDGNNLETGRQGQDDGSGPKTEDGRIVSSDVPRHSAPSVSPAPAPAEASSPESRARSRVPSSLTPTQNTNNARRGGHEPLRLSELSPRKLASLYDDRDRDHADDFEDDNEAGVERARWMDVDVDANANSGNTDVGPLRLSELSPRKAVVHCDDDDEEQAQEQEQEEQEEGMERSEDVRPWMMSPLRPGKKRCSSVGIDERDHDGGHGHERDCEGEEEVRPSKRGKTTTTATSEHRPSTSTSTLPHARKKYKPRADVSASALAGSSSGVRHTHGGGRKHGRERARVASGGAAKSMTRRAARRDPEWYGLPLGEKSQNQNAAPHVQITKPVAFTFRVDARLEARKAGMGGGAGAVSAGGTNGGEERGFAKTTATMTGTEPNVHGQEQGHHRLHRSAPHFPPSNTHSENERGGMASTLPLLPTLATAPLPCSSSSSLSRHTHTHIYKENHTHVHTHPPVPVFPFTFATTQRVEERARFDLAIRLKAEEAERAREAERRLREEEEEREVREMRRRMVPRAREVPGWYRERRVGG
ncbi:hypothetical protein F5I97DRAFT_1880544 [Phlebopus sp. FC_14]|nr:hypothetical protein F5I97DRAFT_1880544 [Phlebopus sp. FC_14]